MATRVADVGIVQGAVLIDGLAIDELEREVGPAIFRDAGIVEPRDVGMLERGQDVALTRHAFEQDPATPS